MSAEAIRASQLEPRDHMILALDRMSWEQAKELMLELSPYFGMVKANSIAQRGGWDDAVDRSHDMGMELMADPKYKDTGRTMEDHVRENALSGSRLITVHGTQTHKNLEYAIKGRDAARAALEEELGDAYDPLVGTLLGITILTDHDERDCFEIYGERNVSSKVMRIATRISLAGLEGMVSSGLELPMLQDRETTRGLLKVIPGIVLDSSGPVPEGQERVVSSDEAIRDGADYVVLGSAVTKADDPIEAAKIVTEQVTDGLRQRAT